MGMLQNFENEECVKYTFDTNIFEFLNYFIVEISAWWKLLNTDEIIHDKHVVSQVIQNKTKEIFCWCRLIKCGYSVAQNVSLNHMHNLQMLIQSYIIALNVCNKNVKTKLMIITIIVFK